MIIQEIRLHSGSLSELQQWLSSVSPQRVLLVRGEKSYRLSGAESILAPILSALPHKEFIRPSLLVKAEELESLADELRTFSPDLILAVGGGAVIDSAKILSILAASSFVATRLHQVDVSTVDAVPLVAVPTTAGAGSESTSFAAIYIDGRKYSIKAPALLPRLAVVDSNLTHSLPEYETACSGIDALCQAIESHWSRNSSAESRKNSKEAISLAFTSLLDAVRNGDFEARQQMAVAANLSGRAINLTGTTGPHAFSYGFTYDFGVAHGHAVALTMLQFMRFNSDFENYKDEDRAHVDQTRERFEEISAALGCASIGEAIDLIGKRFKDCGLNLSFADLNISLHPLTGLSEKVDPVRLSNNPRSIVRDQYRQIFS